MQGHAVAPDGGAALDDNEGAAGDFRERGQGLGGGDGGGDSDGVDYLNRSHSLATLSSRTSGDIFNVLSNRFANLMKFCTEELSIEMVLSALRSDSISIRFTSSCIIGLSERTA